MRGNTAIRGGEFQPGVWDVEHAWEYLVCMRLNKDMMVVMVLVVARSNFCQHLLWCVWQYGLLLAFHKGELERSSGQVARK